MYINKTLVGKMWHSGLFLEGASNKYTVHVHQADILVIFFCFYQLLSLRIATVEHLLPSHHKLITLLCPTNPLPTFHCIFVSLSIEKKEVFKTKLHQTHVFHLWQGILRA